MQTDWEGFFPYYAGYSETFARALLTSAKLNDDAIIFDPWNGSGTTTYAASSLGLGSLGFDLNPVMIIIARARLLPPSEADSIEPLAKEIVKSVSRCREPTEPAEPLASWFGDSTAAVLRKLEETIRERLVGSMTVTPTGINLDRISGLAATFYVALFTVCRELVAPFRSSNPTWLRRPKDNERRIGALRLRVTEKFVENLRSMAISLAERARRVSPERGTSEIKLADATTTAAPRGSVDFVLTSPPYCTRIDYTAATRIELAVLSPLVVTKPEELGRQMTGSVRVPTHAIEVDPAWGTQCAIFLEALRKHPSKASSGYYYRTHLDYFDKLARSVEKIALGLKSDGRAVVVVQDSYYKDIHNDLPSIVTEIAKGHGLLLRRRDNFNMSRSMSGINPYTRAYNRAPGAQEAVLCFRKD